MSDVEAAASSRRCLRVARPQGGRRPHHCTRATNEILCPCHAAYCGYRELPLPPEHRGIQSAELALIESELQKRQTLQHRYLPEISDDKIVIHEGDTRIDTLREINLRFSARGLEEYAARNADYTPVMRFVLQDEAQRVFQPERYCFRGSTEDWISIGEPDRLAKLAARFLKHLGGDSFYDLY